MKEKKFTAEIGEFRAKENGFIEYVGSEGFPLVRVQRRGYLRDERIRSVIDSFLENFCKYFNEGTSGKITIYTVPPQSEDPEIHLRANRSILAKFMWFMVEDKDEFIDALSDLLSTSDFSEMDGVISADRIFTEEICEELKPKIMSKELKE